MSGCQHSAARRETLDHLGAAEAKRRQRQAAAQNGTRAARAEKEDINAGQDGKGARKKLA